MASTLTLVERVCRPIGPFRLTGKVVQGFQRGSKQLGWPTANLDPSAFEHSLDDNEEGVYVGWATVDDDRLDAAARYPVVHKAVLSIGWNPFYQNKQRTLEAYLCHDFGRDFYGGSMRLLVCAFLRPQVDFPGMEALIEAITADVDYGQQLLDAPPWAEMRQDALFTGGVEAAAEPLPPSSSSAA